MKTIKQLTKALEQAAIKFDLIEEPIEIMWRAKPRGWSMQQSSRRSDITTSKLKRKTVIMPFISLSSKKIQLKYNKGSRLYLKDLDYIYKRIAE